MERGEEGSEVIGEEGDLGGMKRGVRKILHQREREVGMSR